MITRLSCPNCGRNGSTTVLDTGKKLLCKGCKTSFVVGQPAPTPPRPIARSGSRAWIGYAAVCGLLVVVAFVWGWYEKIKSEKLEQRIVALGEEARKEGEARQKEVQSRLVEHRRVEQQWVKSLEDSASHIQTEESRAEADRTMFKSSLAALKSDYDRLVEQKKNVVAQEKPPTKEGLTETAKTAREILSKKAYDRLHTWAMTQDKERNNSAATNAMLSISLIQSTYLGGVLDRNARVIYDSMSAESYKIADHMVETCGDYEMPVNDNGKDVKCPISESWKAFKKAVIEASKNNGG